ncbi:uncharacterized protein EDB91DRAFT_1247830 [Suillus paluster]|uniref:uncharacterized protein n=1 Tax=Suillus paluster TaxID=48578 RepID=UPI001B8868BB|nr:uncharacterized protein EDB91DRAFT_1247830 [Suillus paluster]KAG1741775.1 hypothetical protein EDB91DRAFT_1247830 [Suillus paluster]
MSDSSRRTGTKRTGSDHDYCRHVKMLEVVLRRTSQGSSFKADMSHVTTSMQPLSESDTESNFDDLNGDPERISIPGPSASKGELLETLKALQVQIQRLQEENKSIKEENKTLHAEKPKRKRCADTQHKFAIHEDTITIYAHKYGMMVEMFPNGELLNKKLPECPTPFGSSERYTTAATQESAFLDELYCHFPESLHKIMESSYFSDLVLKSIPDTRANEIKKLRGVAGDIFGLSSKYFTNPHYDRAAVPEIQRLLGVTSTTNLTYKTFPPVLFPGLIEDKSMKTILKASLCGISSLHQESSGSGAHTNSLKWSVCQITPGSLAWASVIGIFLLSPDTEFLSTGTGKKSNISYRTLFYLYKKVLVAKWTTKRIITIVTNINCYIFRATKISAGSGEQEDYTDAIDCALAALDMDSDLDVELNTSAQNAVALAAANPVEDPQPTRSLSLGALVEPDNTTISTNAGEVHDSRVSASDILEATDELSQDLGG